MPVTRKIKATRYEDRPNPNAGGFNNATIRVPVSYEIEVFEPEYENPTLSDVSGHKWNVNPHYFATEETATEVMRRLEGVGLTQREFGGAGGPFSVDQKEWVVVFAPIYYYVKGEEVSLPSVHINAGLLAANWTRNPEDKFPGVAETAARRAVWAHRMDMAGLPR